MQLHVVQTEKFSCHSCGNCCRDWHVELMPGEADRITALNWPEGDPLQGAKVLQTFQNRTLLAHRPNGACVFLDEKSNLCRIHAQFGSQVKPIGCRLYPFHILPTFEGEASATARFDCPSVRQNNGSPHADERESLARLADNLGVKDGFDDVTRCQLERDQIEAVTDFAATLLNAFERDDQKSIFLYLLCDWLATTKIGELGPAALGAAFPAFKERVDLVTSDPTTPPGWLQRVGFRTLLSLYLRRDEDILNARAGRIGRTAAMTGIVLGVGGFRGLGLSHPPGRIRSARLFKSLARCGVQPPVDPQAMALHWRMVRTKLRSFQFMGRGNHGRNFLHGLRSLTLLYPLVMAVAKYNAGNRGSATVTAEDADYAVAAIEHSYGRLPILNQPLTRNLEKMLLEKETFVRLVMNI